MGARGRLCCGTVPNRMQTKTLQQQGTPKILRAHGWLYKNPARQERRRPQPSHFLRDCTRGGGLLKKSPDEQAHHQPLPCDLALPPPLPLPPCWPLPSPLDPPYRGPLPAARLAQFAIHSLMEPNFGSEAPMCWKYLDQESVEAFRSRHCACSFSKRSGNLQFETSIAFRASATSPITQSTTMTWNMAMSRETFVASKTGLDSGRVPDFCHHMTQRRLFSSA
mmetsp:Transcript_17160/g.43176  ORF Transcript_17160/g.43176 Transcript_17160/m.43176 type:complete len:222 (-) Transcript_17160:1477-2142(-)